MNIAGITGRIAASYMLVAVTFRKRSTCPLLNALRGPIIRGLRSSRRGFWLAETDHCTGRGIALPPSRGPYAGNILPRLRAGTGPTWQHVKQKSPARILRRRVRCLYVAGDGTQRPAARAWVLGAIRWARCAMMMSQPAAQRAINSSTEAAAAAQAATARPRGCAGRA
eukprot:SAG31_NODE_4046_length_3639_cov_19.403390_2_plen_168_part_00